LRQIQRVDFRQEHGIGFAKPMRRLAWFSWFDDMLDPTRGAQEHLWLALNDSLNAFLLTFESTLQFLPGPGLRARKLKAWLEGQCNAYDTTVRGLRALRHFTAHVDNKRSTGIITVTPGQDIRSTRHLPVLEPKERGQVDRALLSADQWSEWSEIVSETPARTVMEVGLIRLRGLLELRQREIDGAEAPVEIQTPHSGNSAAPTFSLKGGGNAGNGADRMTAAIGSLQDGEYRKVVDEGGND